MVNKAEPTNCSNAWHGELMPMPPGVTIILAITFAGQRRVNSEALGFVERGFAPHYANGSLAEVNALKTGGQSCCSRATYASPASIVMARI